ncbi:arginine catabolic regulator [Weissella diestrammenae]|uniref:Arginine repressor n=1 Tax=Weissella diestrammenae TaxID=1162633 RepID=A0A7G9T4B5_9LACO|nr:arginine catabolic regulator [Weissella diestrammenae]MCM0583474.1 arginine catabolic regulator [Weissella diestrammenae]QNN74940.1 arginine catabolic regulator [Weissella diestrammenae]
MARNKTERQADIKQIINEVQVQTQEELVELLNARGWDVTQATVSRDIASMQLVKVPLDAGGFAYGLMNGADYLSQIGAIMVEKSTTLRVQANMVMIRVVPGTGPAIKTAIEEVNFPEVFGIIGDDAGVLIITTEKTTGAEFAKKLRQLK